MFDNDLSNIKAYNQKKYVNDLAKEYNQNVNYNAFYMAAVVDTNDPEHIGRVRIRIPAIHGVHTGQSYYLTDDELPWARPGVMNAAGNDMGQFLVPQKGSRVFVTFELDSPDSPIYFGGIITIIGNNEKYYNDNDDIYSGAAISVVDNDLVKTQRDTNAHDVIYKSFKGATIEVDDKDGQECIRIIDASGQVFEMGVSNPDKIPLERRGVKEDSANPYRYIKIKNGSESIEMIDGKISLEATNVVVNGITWYPISTPDSLGGIKVGDYLLVSADGTLSVQVASTTLKGVVKLVNSLISTDSNSALTAAQGKVLKDFIDIINDTLSKLGTAANADIGLNSGNVPVLGSDGKLNSSVIPAIALTSVTTCSSEAAMLALDAQMGDVCVRTDENKIYMLQSEPASTLSNWIAIEIPITVDSVNGKTGVVTLTGADIDTTYTNYNGISITSTISAALTAISNNMKTIKTNRQSYVTTIGDGSTTSFSITHNLNSMDVIVQLVELSTGQIVYTDVTITSQNVITLDFSNAPSSNQFKVIILNASTI